MEESVGLVACKRFGASNPGGTDSEALHGWVLKFREDSTRVSTSAETFVDCLANGSPPWAAYCTFISGRLISLVKQLGMRTIGVGENWRCLFPRSC